MYLFLKTSLCCFFIFIVSTKTSAQVKVIDQKGTFKFVDTSKWSLSGGNLSNKNSGNIGIGITNPTAKLHTIGSLRFEGLATDTLNINLLTTDNLGNITKRSLSNLLKGNAITSINGLTNSSQKFAIGDTGTNFTISSIDSTHTFNFPTASATKRGLLDSTDWKTFRNKIDTIQGTIPITVSTVGTKSTIGITRRNIVTGISVDAASAPLVLDAATDAVVGSANTMLTVNNTAALWNANKLQGRDIATTSPTDGQLLTWDATTSTWIPAGYAVKTITATTYTLLASDHGKILDFTAPTAITLTVPNTLSVGFQVSITQASTGNITFTNGAGMTINNRWSGTRTAGRWAKAGIEIRATGSAVLSGDVF